MDKIILILCICQCVLSVSQCSISEKKSDEQLWTTLKPSDFQNYFLAIICILAILGLLPTIASWKLYRSFSIPSDIMFAICMANIVKNLSMLGSAVYFMIHHQDIMPDNFKRVCIGSSILYSIGNISSLLYNTVFCIVLSLSISKTLKGSLFSQPLYHSLVVISVISITIGLGMTSSLGQSQGGICGFRAQSMKQLVRIIIQLIVVAICLFCMYLFRMKIPKNSYFKKVAVFGYYYYYMGLFSLIQLVSTISYLISNITCRMGVQHSSDIIKIAHTFGICSQMVLSFVLILLRFSHPAVRLKIKKIFNPTYEIKLEEEEEEEDSSSNNNPEEEPWLGSLLESIKGSQILSFLSAILVTFAEQRNKIQKEGTMSKFSFAKNYKLKLNESMTDQYVLRYISNRESVIMQQKLSGLCSLDYKVTVYSIQTFSQMLSKQQYMNIFNSFNINLNIKLVKQQSYIRGGKSGQFFFGTHDNKFIIKTVSQNQAFLYKEKIQEFYQYYKENPKSLIARIYGLYKFKRSDIHDEPVYIILMKNISPYERRYQERVYDIKGSEFNRSTMQEERIENQEKLKYHTLKDEDFKKLERKIYILPEYSALLKAQLKKDAEFLGRMEVMDYSMLVIKRKGQSRDQSYHFNQNQLNELPCSQSNDIYYNIGIIDYLQSWTLKRKAERAFKSMITKKKITVASPEQYSRRLSNFIDEII